MVESCQVFNCFATVDVREYIGHEAGLYIFNTQIMNIVFGFFKVGKICLIHMKR